MFVKLTPCPYPLHITRENLTNKNFQSRSFIMVEETLFSWPTGSGIIFNKLQLKRIRQGTKGTSNFKRIRRKKK